MILYGEANKSTQTIVEFDYKTPDWFNLPERHRFGTMAKANLAAQTPANFSVPVVYSSSLSRSGASLSFHKQLSKPHDVGSAETRVISGFSLPRCYILIAAADAGILRRSVVPHSCSRKNPHMGPNKDYWMLVSHDPLWRSQQEYSNNSRV